MKRIFLPLRAVVIGSLFTLAPGLSAIADESPAPTEKTESLKAREDYAHHFASMVLAIVQDNKKNFDERRSVLRNAFSKSVDIDWIAKFVLGNAWARATEEQREKYMTLYRKFLTETYVANFAENPDRRIRDIKIFNVTEDNNSDFTVRTEMQLADMEDMKVNYLVNDDLNGHYRVRDIAIENVSLITTHRSEFSQLANTHGVDGVLSELQKRIDTLQEQQQQTQFSSNAPNS